MAQTHRHMVLTAAVSVEGERPPAEIKAVAELLDRRWQQMVGAVAAMYPQVRLHQSVELHDVDNVLHKALHEVMQGRPPKPAARPAARS